MQRLSHGVSKDHGEIFRHGAVGGVQPDTARVQIPLQGLWPVQQLDLPKKCAAKRGKVQYRRTEPLSAWPVSVPAMTCVPDVAILSCHVCSGPDTV